MRSQKGGADEPRGTESWERTDTRAGQPERGCERTTPGISGEERKAVRILYDELNPGNDPGVYTAQAREQKGTTH